MNHKIFGLNAGVDLVKRVVLMDIQMPIVDGYMATMRLRQKGFKTPIIALTAHAMIEERQKCLEVGCNEHLTKPLNANELIDRVHHFANLYWPNLSCFYSDFRTKSQFYFEWVREEPSIA